MITRKAGLALAAGCIMVLKPATATPFSALALCELAERAGVRKGVFSCVTGPSNKVGGELTSNPTVRKLTFTGSTEVGILLMQQCAFAGDGSRRFSNSDIKGNYGLLAQASSAVAGTQIAFPAVFVGRVSSDGKGKLRGMGTINPGGPISGFTPGQLVALNGTYEVDDDGTGEYTGSAAPPSPSAASNSSDPPSVLGSGALVIAAPNDEIQLASTQNNRVLYITLKKQHPPVGATCKCQCRPS